MFQPADLRTAIIAAPMAGGPSTPALCVAVTAAGGLGVLAAGSRPAAQLAAQLTELRAAGAGPVGVNLCVPAPRPANPERLADYRDRLRPLAEAAGLLPAGAELPLPAWDDDDWAAKLELLAARPPEFLSFTFGCPEPATLARFAALGVHTSVTVTSRAEAELAAAAGAASLTVQGPEAGGHRGTFDQRAAPGEQPLLELLAEVRAQTALPLIAAGGLGSPAAVEAVLDSGAAAAQAGTAFLLAAEAGTNPVHRAALTDPAFASTELSRAFSGRWARGLRNEWMAALDPFAPAGYPEIDRLTAPLRAAAVAAGRPQLTNLWAGAAHREARAAPAAAIVADLCPASRR